MTQVPYNPAGLGVLYVPAGVFAISINDMLSRPLSGSYPLHDLIFFRCTFGLMAFIGLMRMEGGWQTLKARCPFRHLTGTCVSSSQT